MTNREFLTSVINAGISTEMTEYATAAIEKLDASNARKAEKNAEKRAAEAPLYEALTAALTAEPQTASELATVIEVSTQKCSAMMRKLVEQGVATKTEVKVEKGRKAMGYSIA